jgi:hypothetical protein
VTDPEERAALRDYPELWALIFVLLVLSCALFMDALNADVGGRLYERQSSTARPAGSK